MPSVQDQTNHVAAIASVVRLEARVAELEAALREAEWAFRLASTIHVPDRHLARYHAAVQGTYDVLEGGES